MATKMSRYDTDPTRSVINWPFRIRKKCIRIHNTGSENLANSMLLIFSRIKN